MVCVVRNKCCELCAKFSVCFHSKIEFFCHIIFAMHPTNCVTLENLPKSGKSEISGSQSLNFPNFTEFSQSNPEKFASQKSESWAVKMCCVVQAKDSKFLGLSQSHNFHNDEKCES